MASRAGLALLALVSFPSALASGLAGGRLWAAVSTPPPGGPAPAPGPAPIAAVDPGLVEPAPGLPGRTLPRIGDRGARPLDRYAARAPSPAPGVARIAIVLDGIGTDHRASLEAVRALPAPVALAFSPYAEDPGAVVAAARAAGHEMLASIPMTPAGAPEDDEGDMQLVPGGDPAENARRLDWALALLPGAVGATGAETGLGGERVAADRATIDRVGAALAARGLLYVDPVPGDAPVEAATQADATLMLDPDATGAALADALRSVEARASRDGRALLIAGPPNAALVARLARWCAHLRDAGIALVPASALAAAPADSPDRPPVVTVPDDPRALAAALGDVPDRGEAR